MIGRRTFLRTVAGGFLATPLTIDAQRVDKIYRVGWLSLGRAWSLNPFRRGLSELGWIEGRNIAIETRWADNDADRLPVLAAELVQLKVDVIVTQTTPAALAAKKATASIPIVMAGSSSPDQLGLVKSLARPGENVTGITNNPGSGFTTKMVQLLKEAAPRVSRLAVLERRTEGNLREIETAAPALGLTVLNAEASIPDQVLNALTVAVRERADGLFVSSTPVNDVQRRLIVDFALANRLPSICGDRDFVSAGGLMSYWTDWVELRRKTATYVDKILRGANPGDLSIEQPTKFELVINVKTAKALGLMIPQLLLQRADEVIQ